MPENSDILSRLRKHHTKEKKNSVLPFLVSCQDEIETALENGYSVRAIHSLFVAEGKTSISYQAFTKALKRAKIFLETRQPHTPAHAPAHTPAHTPAHAPADTQPHTPAHSSEDEPKIKEKRKPNIVRASEMVTPLDRTPTRKEDI